MGASGPPLLEVENLTVDYQSSVNALRGVTFQQSAGEVLGVLGESGSGKSTLGLTIPGLLPPAGSVTSGEARFLGQVTTGASEPLLRRLRGARIGCILQHPGEALHPLKRVGHQVLEVLRAHVAKGSGSLEEIAAERLAEVGLADPELFRAYPSQLSGGQRQRVFVAQALACRPDLVVADEPTASLDSIHRRQIAELLARLAKGGSRRDRTRRPGCAVLFITHQPELLDNLADRILVLYRGRMIELGTTQEVLRSPRHPYTSALLSCQPRRISSARPRPRLPTLPAPRSEDTATGCPYASRCPRRRPICELEFPEHRRLSSTHTVACFDPLA